MSWWGGDADVTTDSKLQQQLDDLQAEYDVLQQSLEMKASLLTTTQADLREAIVESKSLRAKVDEHVIACSQLRSELLAAKAQVLAFNLRRCPPARMSLEASGNFCAGGGNVYGIGEDGNDFGGRCWPADHARGQGQGTRRG